MAGQGSGTVLAHPDSDRRRGIRNIVIGLAVLIAGVVFYDLVEGWLLTTFGTRQGDRLVVEVPSKLVLVMCAPALAGYVLFMSGLYRLIFGARGRTLSAAWSAFRILFGLTATIGLIGVWIAVYGWLRR